MAGTSYLSTLTSLLTGRAPLQVPPGVALEVYRSLPTQVPATLVTMRFPGPETPRQYFLNVDTEGRRFYQLITQGNPKARPLGLLFPDVGPIGLSEDDRLFRLAFLSPLYGQIVSAASVAETKVTLAREEVSDLARFVKDHEFFGLPNSLDVVALARLVDKHTRYDSYFVLLTRPRYIKDKPLGKSGTANPERLLLFFGPAGRMNRVPLTKVINRSGGEYEIRTPIGEFIFSGPLTGHSITYRPDATSATLFSQKERLTPALLASLGVTIEERDATQNRTRPESIASSRSHPLLDYGAVQRRIREIRGQGVPAGLELRLGQTEGFRVESSSFWVAFEDLVGLTAGGDHLYVASYTGATGIGPAVCQVSNEGTTPLTTMQASSLPPRIRQELGIAS